MNIRKKDIEGKWYKYDDTVSFLVRPYKSSMFDFESTEHPLKQQFMYCIADWKGITSEDNKTIFECDEKNKEYIHEYYIGIVTFINTTIEKIAKRMHKSVKNSKTPLNGDTGKKV